MERTCWDEQPEKEGSPGHETQHGGTALMHPGDIIHFSTKKEASTTTLESKHWDLRGLDSFKRLLQSSGNLIK
ncbi:hypothetical protein MRB53_000863 [Persea americana]|uniref:Uncharacterized protein n=1 Tax=Persea americana TaxID=3435 RepID=A0ACC2MQZ7_PERAE|nr:hypothetical protein MRB53_000863 [Persea americana]